jgi:hypothetical protein
VRRREWVRLRGIVPVQTGGDDDPSTQREEAKGGDGLSEVMAFDEVERNLVAVEKALGRYALDREKLEVWDGWLKRADLEAKRQLRAVLDDAECVSGHLNGGHESCRAIVLSLLIPSYIYWTSNSPIARACLLSTKS